MSDESDVVYVVQGNHCNRRYHEDEGCSQTAGTTLVKRSREIAEAWYAPCQWCATDDTPAQQHDGRASGPKSILEQMVEAGEIDTGGWPPGEADD